MSHKQAFRNLRRSRLSYGATGYETRCAETGIIGTGVIDYYISPVTYQIQNITGFLTGCVSRRLLSSGVTGVVSGVVRTDTVLIGYDSVLQGYETGATTGYETGIIRPIYRDSLVSSTSDTVNRINYTRVNIWIQRRSGSRKTFNASIRL